MTKIFLSYKHNDQDLAENVRYHLRELSDSKIDIQVSQRMQGGKDWRKWINDNIESSDIFLLLYTGGDKGWGWCIFEAGKFEVQKEETRPLITLTPASGEFPPDQLRHLQTYKADAQNVRRFLTDLVKDGVFTEGKPINGNISQSKLSDAVEEIYGYFKRSRKTVDFFSRRINIELHGEEFNSHDIDIDSILDTAVVSGTSSAFEMLGQIGKETCSWQDLLAEFDDYNGAWLSELKTFIHSQLPGAKVKLKENPRVLSRFAGKEFGVNFLPILSRIEKLDNSPTIISIIFVYTETSRDIEKELDMYHVPPRVSAIIRLLNLARRYRWEILEPFKDGLESLIRAIDEDSQEPNASIDVMRKIHEEFADRSAKMEREGEEGRFHDQQRVKAVLELNEDKGILDLWNKYYELKEKINDNVESGNIYECYENVDKIAQMNKQFLVFGLEYYLKEIKKGYA